MLLICPSCSTHYEVAETKIPSAGRSVKCAACGHAWVAGPWNHSNYGAQKSFENKPVYSDTLSVPSPSYISRPMSASRGGAALAALFDEHVLEDAEEIIEGRCEPVEKKPEFISIEERLEEALSTTSIARLIDQQTGAETQNSPFHEGLAVLQDHTSQHDETERSGKHVGDFRQPEEAEVSVAFEAGKTLRRAASLLVTGFMVLGDRIDAMIPDQLWQHRENEKAMATPGDQKVSEWRERQRRIARNRMTPLRLLGWLGWAMTITGLVVGVTIYRDVVMTWWPESKTAYAALGLPVSGASFATLDNLDYRYALSDQGPVIELRGTIVHAGERPIATPLVRAETLSANGDVLSSWIFRARGTRQMLPNSELPFLTRSLAPAGVATIAMSVVSEEERAALGMSGIEKITIADPAAGQQEFFMQRTTSGWQYGQMEPPTEAEPQP